MVMSIHLAAAVASVPDDAKDMPQITMYTHIPSLSMGYSDYCLGLAACS